MIIKILKNTFNHLFFKHMQPWRYGCNADELIQYCTMKLNNTRLIHFQNKYKDKLKNQFYIIILTNSLHLVEPCLKLIPKKIYIILILNGLTNWEEMYIKNKYTDYPTFKLTNLNNRPIPHGRVLDLLFEINKLTFGIIDYDCYIFNKNIFNNLELEENEFVAGPFFSENSKLKLTFPRTFFLFFNTYLINKIRNKYRVSCYKYDIVPLHLKERLSQIGMDSDNFPYEDVKVFDTFQLIIALAFCEKLCFKQLKIGKDEIIHVGSTTYYLNQEIKQQMLKDKLSELSSHKRSLLIRSVLAHYFHFKLLNSSNDAVRSKYLPIFISYGEPGKIFKRFSNILETSLIKQTDDLINKLDNI